MKKLILLLLLATTALGQKLPQKTTYKMGVVNNFPAFKTDTVGHNDDGVWVRILDYATYYYNYTDSFFVRPIFFIPKEVYKDSIIPMITTIEITIPKDLPGINKAEFKFIIPKCESSYFGYEYKEEHVSRLADPKNCSVINGWTILFLEVKNQYEFKGAFRCYTKNVELKINEKVFVPNQEREKIEYFEYTRMFIDKLAFNSPN